MLSQAEEEALKRLARNEEVLGQMARNSAPPRIENPGHITGIDAGESAHAVGLHIKKLFDRLGPTVIVGGPAPEQSQWPLAQAGEDQAVIERVRHTMRNGEQLGQWYSRVGLGRAQILRMSKKEISRFVEVAELNSASGQ